MRIPLKLIAEEMKRKCLLRFREGVKAEETLKLTRGLVVTLALKKNKKDKEYWVLILQRPKVPPSDREIIICQETFFPGEPPVKEKRKDSAIILIWRAKCQ